MEDREKGKSISTCLAKPNKGFYWCKSFISVNYFLKNDIPLYEKKTIHNIKRLNFCMAHHLFSLLLLFLTKQYLQP